MDNLTDVLDKIIIFVALGKESLENHELESTLIWRMKEGKTTDEDKEHISWSKDFISKKFKEIGLMMNKPELKKEIEIFLDN